MVKGWLPECGLTSIMLRPFGYIPHSRLFKDAAHYAMSKQQTLEFLESQGYDHRFELSGTPNLKSSTKDFADQIMGGEIDFGAWTAIVIDRKKVPTVLFAFRESTDAVRARLVLEVC